MLFSVAHLTNVNVEKVSIGLVPETETREVIIEYQKMLKKSLGLLGTLDHDLHMPHVLVGSRMIRDRSELAGVTGEVERLIQHYVPNRTIALDSVEPYVGNDGGACLRVSTTIGLFMLHHLMEADAETKESTDRMLGELVAKAERGRSFFASNAYKAYIPLGYVSSKKATGDELGIPEQLQSNRKSIPIGSVIIYRAGAYDEVLDIYAKRGVHYSPNPVYAEEAARIMAERGIRAGHLGDVS